MLEGVGESTESSGWQVKNTLLTSIPVNNTTRPEALTLPDAALLFVVVIPYKQSYADNSQHEFQNYYQKVGHNK